MIIYLLVIDCYKSNIVSSVPMTVELHNHCSWPGFLHISLLIVLWAKEMPTTMPVLLSFVLSSMLSLLIHIGWECFT